MMPFNIVLLGIYHESNTFIDKPTTITDFEKGHWFTGDRIFSEYSGSFHEIGGMISELKEHDVNIIPVMFAEATPGGTIKADVYNTLTEQMFRQLEKVKYIDGCLAIVHGAAVSENYPDMDGQWLSELRRRLGNDIPVVGTLDPHANVSEAMANATNALIAYSTNPHTDQFETGKKAAAMLMDTLMGKITPVQKLFPSYVTISIEQQYTAADPCLALYNHAELIRMKEDLLHITINLGFPYADVQEMGTSFIVISNYYTKKTDHAGEQLIRYMYDNRKSFVGQKQNIQSIFPLLSNAAKPVLLLDMGDNIGGGSPGNSTYLLRVFEKNNSQEMLICMYDPKAVQRCINFHPGEQFLLSLTDDQLMDPYTLSVTLLKLVDGLFTENMPRHGGQVNYDMGKTAIVKTSNGNTIMLMSHRIPPFSLQQLTGFDIDPDDYDVIVAKGVIAPIAAYKSVCKTIWQVDTPGVTQADMTMFTYRNRRKPLYPFDTEL